MVIIVHKQIKANAIGVMPIARGATSDAKPAVWFVATALKIVKQRFA